MADDHIAYGQQAQPGRYRCADCGIIIRTACETYLPPCPHYNSKTHKLKGWQPQDVPVKPRAVIGPAK